MFILFSCKMSPFPCDGQFHEVAPLTRTWLWSMQLPQIPQPSHQRNTLILILTWGTETSAGPLNSASEHRSKIYCYKPLGCGLSPWREVNLALVQVQRYSVDERGASPVPGGAGDPHHRPHGSDQLPLCAAAGLCDPEIPPWISCENRYGTSMIVPLPLKNNLELQGSAATPVQ